MDITNDLLAGVALAVEDKAVVNPPGTLGERNVGQPACDLMQCRRSTGRLFHRRLHLPDEYSLANEIGHQAIAPCYGPHEAGTLCYIDVFRRTGRVKGTDPLEPLMRLTSNAGWWWAFAGACIIAERPMRLVRDAAHRLHCADGPALLYPDGWAIYAWHGLRIPARMIEDKQRITPDAIEAEENAELRRVMLEIFGFDRYIAARGAKLIAEDECLGLPRQLFEIKLQGERIRVLRVVNGTVEADGRRRQFHLGVLADCNTPHEAVAWSY